MPAYCCSRVSLGIVFALGVTTGWAADWPTYRADAARSGYTVESLPESLALVWVHKESHPPRPAWPTSDRIHFDLVDQPVAVGPLVLLGTSADDRVVALDRQTGRVRWTFFAGGPVRFAPAVWRDRVFVASDDGFLYALALADGRLLWKHRGGPNGRMILGNDRMISRWPARGGPVVLDDKVYYAAGIWPTGGVYLHALDASSGAVLWTNDSSGELTMGQPHGGAMAKSGVAPQGYLVAGKDHLLAPTGRAVPAAFDRATGAFAYYHLQSNHSIGGSRAFLTDRFLACGGCLFDEPGGGLAARCGRGVLTPVPEGLLQISDSALVVHRWADLEAKDAKNKTVAYRGLRQMDEIVLDVRPVPESIVNALGRYSQFKSLYELKPQFAAVSSKVLRGANIEVSVAQLRPELRAMGVSTEVFLTGASEKSAEAIVAGDDVILGCEGTVRVVSLSAKKIRWSHPVEGCALGLAVAQGRLLVSTTEGRLYSFGRPEERDTTANSTPAGVADSRVTAPPTADADPGRLAEEILRRANVTEGLCLDLGGGALALELARRSKLQICCLEPDPAKVERARRWLAAAGLYGVRVSVEQGNSDEPPYPAACADLVVSSYSLQSAGKAVSAETMRRLARPWGGAVCTGRAGTLEVDVRGPLPGAGQWTHQNADAANTLCSGDRLVHGPLEMRWFRDVDFEITDRHAQGPAPLSIQGVLVVEGVNGLCALDAYNGRTLWTCSLPGILKDQDGVHHDVGAGDTGGNVCLDHESVYVAEGPRCLRMELRTGRRLSEFVTPGPPGDRHRAWGFIACHDGLLYGSVLNDEHPVSPRYAGIRLRTESLRFFALAPATGQVRWQYVPKDSIRNNAIAIAGRAVYLIDRPLTMTDRIITPPSNGKHRPTLKPDEQVGGTLLALDAATGRELWRQSEGVVGTQLAVSEPHHTLLMFHQAVPHPFFKLPSEVGGRMVAFDTRTGKRLWERQASPKTRPMIVGEKIYALGGCWDLQTGDEIPFVFKRTHGCGQVAAGASVLLFRSATLAYVDLTRTAGTENFGGIRPGCWINAIPAAGLALVPDGSAKCACSYQMHAWLALQPRE